MEPRFCRITITMDNGIKVGIFGLLGTNALKLAPHAAPVTVASPAKAAQEVVDHLREVEKCDFIVGLSHGELVREIFQGKMRRSQDGSRMLTC